MHIQKKSGPVQSFSDVAIIKSYHPEVCCALIGALITGEGVDRQKLEQRFCSYTRLILVHNGHTESAVINLIDPITNFTSDGVILPKISQSLDVMDPIRIPDKGFKLFHLDLLGMPTEIAQKEFWNVWFACLK